MTSLPPKPPAGNNADKLLEQLPESARRFLQSQGVEPSSVPTNGPPPGAELRAAPPPIGCGSERGSERPPSPRAEPERAPQHTHRSGPKPSRASRVHARRRALERREAAYLERLTERAKAAGHCGEGIRAIPLRVWVRCAQVVADPTGKAARIHLRQLVNRTAAGAILQAAIPPDSDRTWASLRVRRIAALGLALVWLGKYTARRGPWNCLVRAVPRGALATLLRDPFDQRKPPPAPAADKRRQKPPGVPSITALFGTHRPDAPVQSSNRGYFCALRDAGLVYRQQVPAAEAERGEVGPNGYACNRYWLATDANYTPDWGDARERAAELSNYAAADAAQLGRQLMHERAARAAQATAPPS